MRRKLTIWLLQYLFWLSIILVLIFQQFAGIGQAQLFRYVGF